MKAHRIVAIGITGVAAAAAVAIACTGLSDFQLNTCGNSIIEQEAGEQCDNIPIEGFICYGKDAGVRGCHVQCGDGGTCPSGWACGGDKVCRKPSGTFVAASTIVDDVGSLVIGDFDGDGQKDVMTRGTGVVRVHYFDAVGAEITSTTLSVPRGHVISADLGDGGSSLVVFDSDPASGFKVTGTGIDVFRGAMNRTLSPVLFQSTPIPGATDARTFAAHVINKFPGADDILVFADSPQFGGSGILAFFAEGGQFEPIGMIPAVVHAAGATIVNDIPVAPIPPATCDSAVIGYTGAKTVTVVRTCASPATVNLAPFDGGPGPVAPATFAFLDPIAGPILVYDTDKDGNLDIVTTAAQMDGTISLLKGDGSGGFTASRVPTATKGTLWAIGDVDADGQTDGIDDHGLLLSKTGTRYPTADVVSYAQIRDINHDGFVDAVAMTVNGVDVWLGTGNASPNHRYYNIPSTQLITLGDADGDSNLDILVASGPGAATLSIMWGNYAAYPNEPVAMGTVGQSQHLASGKFTWFFGEPSDSLAAFVDMTTDPQNLDAGISVVPIRGRADRQLTAPFVLSTGTTLGDRSNPLFGTTSAVPNDAGVIVPSVSMVAAKPQGDASLDALPMTLWTAHGTSGGGVLDPIDVIKPPVDDAGTPLITMLASDDAGNTLGITAVDLDPANKNGDELVVVVPNDQMTIAKLAPFDGGTVWQPQQPSPFDGGAPNGKALKVLPGDFDGDGLRDVLVVFAGSTPNVLAATVYFNDGQGHLVNPTPVLLEGAVAVTTIHALPSALTQVAAINSKGLRLYSGPKLVPLPLNEAQLIPNVIDMASGDVNGDGLEDLVVASATSIQVLLGTVMQ